ncbi:MAG: carbonic anhydrase [Bdellovibrionaceae bacterium]|nr:carbonic anhydrase [Pseudobdellovibrionaceae bacterium]
MNTKISTLLLKNKNWASEKVSKDSSYFTKLLQQRKPSVFWIGCCDARVIPSEIISSSLSDIFMHTNIANQVNSNDTNLIAALTFAVNTLKVEHIVVCGHTDCRGVQAAMDNNSCEVLKDWLRPLQNLYKKNNSLDTTAFSELNIKNQVKKVQQHTLLQNHKNPPQVHGWIFQIETGTIKALC